jgi:glycosyltransferase involved in cell wall biosynthesis
MKILYVHTSYEQSGGEDLVFANEVELMRREHEVQQLLFNNGGNRILRFFKFLFAPYNPFSIYRLNEMLKKEKPDVIHLHNWHFGASPGLISVAKKHGIPLVLTLHNYRILCPSATLFHKDGLYKDSLKAGFPWKAVKNRVYRNSYIQTFWLAFTVHFHKWLRTWQDVNKYITLSPFAEQLFLDSTLKLTRNQLAVKPNFVADPGYTTADRGVCFLFVGRLCIEKGLHHLIAAFKDLPYTLTIAGDGPLREYVEAASKTHANIQYQGKKDKAEIFELMRSASALIFPSIWFEGMPMTILEAFSTGTAVIAGRLGTMESLIGNEENGILYTPGDVRALKKAVASWVSNSPAQRLQISKSARDAYERLYTPESNMNQILTIYNSVIKEY